MTTTKIEPPPDGLAKLREPFPEHHISKLPKETGTQAKQRKADIDAGKWPPKCEVCGGFHHVKAVHLDYVGHAALTDRLLDTDPMWAWEPLALGPDGLPARDQNGGLWIKLTVLGMTRLGYGDADGKTGGNAVKEAIGDALRNAAMRFGAALDLWHKGDLHIDEPADEASPETAEAPTPAKGWREPDSIYSTPTKLHSGLITHQCELNRLASESTFDDLDAYLTSEEYREFIRVCLLHAEHYLDGPKAEGTPPEFIQMFNLETKARDMIAIRGNVPADKEHA